MRLRERFKRLTLWNKIGAVGALTSIIGVPLTLVLYFYPFSRNKRIVRAMTATSSAIAHGPETERNATAMMQKQLVRK